jgi:hypothetical protein
VPVDLKHTAAGKKARFVAGAALTAALAVTGHLSLLKDQWPGERKPGASKWKWLEALVFRGKRAATRERQGVFHVLESGKRREKRHMGARGVKKVRRGID